MKQPDEIPAIQVQEHLKIVVTEILKTGNIATPVAKTILCQRVK